MRSWIAGIGGTLMLMAGPSLAAAECPAGSTPLMILGTFHFAGSSEDAVSTDPGDMTTPRRQAEIQALVERLLKFQPTKVAIESSRISHYWNERYAAWRRDRGPLGSNEIEQVGFRLADRAGLAALSPVDYPMWMDGTTAADRHEPPPAPAAESTPDEAESAFVAGIRAQIAADERVLRDGTLSDYLVYLNRPERAVLNHHWDVFSNLVPGPGTAMYEKTDYATNWYKRNLRIYTNLVAIAGPQERLLLLIGAGHTHLLTGLAASDPRFCLVPIEELLARQ
jgi:hypothetical protein